MKLAAEDIDLAYADVLSALDPRPWLIEGSFASNSWLIKPSSHPQSTARPLLLSFDEPIGGWPNCSRLGDDRHAEDRLTCKLLVYESLEAGTGWINSASTLEIFHRQNVNFVRFKEEINVRRNAELSAAHHREYIKRFSSQGYPGVIGVKRRVAKLIKGFERGEIEVVLSPKGYFFHEGLLNLIGIGINQMPLDAKTTLEEFALSKGYKFSSGKYTRRPPRKKSSTLSKTHGNSGTRIWKILADLRPVLQHDPIGYVAYSSKSEQRNPSQGWTQTGRRTLDAPEYQLSFLVNAALKLLLSDLPEELLNLAAFIGFTSHKMTDSGVHEVSERLKSINSALFELGFQSISNVYSGQRWFQAEKAFLTIREAIFETLIAACTIVIAAFSARRRSELFSLLVDCISSDDYDELWLKCFITKNGLFTTKVPATATIRAAVDMLNRIGRETRQFGDRKLLLQFFDAQGGVKFAMNDCLKLFAQWCDVPALPNGEHWEFTSHQFRKFFATTFQWRYFFRDLATLNHQLRQRDINTTVAYTKMEGAAAMRLQDRSNSSLDRTATKRALERIEDLRDEEERYMTTILTEVVSGERVLRGLGGKQLTAQLEDFLNAQIDVVASAAETNALNVAIRNFVSGLSMQMHPEGHSICKCSSNVRDKSSAQCLLKKCRFTGNQPHLEPGADYGYSDDESCSACSQNIKIVEILPYWENELSRIEKSKTSNVHAETLKSKEREILVRAIISDLEV